MGLRHGDTKEPVAVQVCICPVDARNGGKADQGQIQYLVESSLRWTAFGTTWDHPSEAIASCVGTRRGAGAAMAQAGIPKIKALARREKADIYFGDAAHMRSDHHSGRTWGKKGETPVVFRTGARYRMSLISAVTS